ncbi:MAG: exopolygalacturonase, partial [Bacteroidales bacterium]|nr:exopolygalacturonase [Bacteroidales bacterium]
MKKIFISLLAIALVLPLGAKKTKEKPFLFPDGTPVPEWFLDSKVPTPSELGKIYSIADYGAISDPNNLQTALIQGVIDKAAEEGGGVIVIPEGIYKTGALFFKQGTHLYLSRGAVLLGSEFIYDFPLIETRIEGEICKYFSALINVDGLDGFTLTGPGTIDGNGSPYWRAFRIRRQWNPKCTNKDEQRPRLVHISNSKNVIVADATLQNSPFWTCHTYKTDHIKFINLRIFSPVSPIRSASADGIDLDVCSNVLVKGCRITVNDDAVCFKGGKGPWADTDPANGPIVNVLVEDCFFDRTTGSCVTCGSECIGTHNIIVRNCTV